MFYPICYPVPAPFYDVSLLEPYVPEPPRIPRRFREVKYIPGPPGKVMFQVRRLPTPSREIIETLHVVKPSELFSNQYENHHYMYN